MRIEVDHALGENTLGEALHRRGLFVAGVVVRAQHLIGGKIA